MISATQRKALAVLAELCELSTEVRLGQLMALLGPLGEDRFERGLWDLDDEQLLDAMYQHQRDLMARRSATLGPAIPTIEGS
jgi:hypothetical protein